MKPMGWKTRAGIVLSALWLIVVLVIASNETNATTFVLFFGVAPLALVWGIVWVVRGFREEKRADTASADPQAARERKAIWLRRLLGLALLISAFVAVGYFASRSGDWGHWGYFLGYYIWVPLIAWALWSAVLKQKKGYLLLIVGVAYALAGTWEAFRLNRDYEEVTNFAKHGSAIFARMATGDSVSLDEITNAKFGRFEPLMLATQNYYSTLLKVFVNLQRHIEAAGLDTLLSAQTYRSTSTIGEARQKLVGLRNVVEDAEIEISRIMDRFAIEAKAVTLPAGAQASFSRSFEESLPRNKAAIKEFLGIQREFLNQSDQLLKFMLNTQGSYVISGNQVLFRRQSDLSDYNSHLSRISSLAAKELAWRKNYQETVFSQIRKLSDLGH